MPSFQLFIGNKNVSSWSLRPWIAMRHHGLAFEEHLVRLRTPETRAALDAVSPSGQVPVLTHDGRKVWESLAILEYLNELFPEWQLWPADLDARTHARTVATEMHAGFREVRYQWPMNLRRVPALRPLEGEGVHQRARIERVWMECRERYGKGGPFLFGSFGAADAMYAPVVTRFHSYGGPLSGAVKDYVEAMLALPAMRDWFAGAAAETFPEPSPDE